MENSFLELVNYITMNSPFKCHNYKEKPLKRRIRVRMRALNIVDYSQYLNLLKQDKQELKKLLAVLTINLSYFFRNLEVFDYLKDDIFPKFSSSGESLIFWSAGCAQGEEAYSLAIIAAEKGLLENLKVFGTDIDKEALNKAQEGVYSLISFQYTPEYLKKKYFTRIDDAYEIHPNIKKGCNF